MTTKTIATLVDRGLEIKAAAKALADELKVINDQLTAAGLAGEQIPLEEADRPGKQWLAAGTGKIVPVVFESDQIVGSVPFGGDLQERILAAVPVGADQSQGFLEFFRPKYERIVDDSLKFRRAAFASFGPDGGARFVDACLQRDKDGIPKSRVVVSWDRARDAGISR